MSEKFTVEIISPDRTIFKSDAEEVIIPSFEGQMGILKDHIPLITFLRPGILSIKNQTQKDFFVEEGTVEFSNNNLLILTATAKDLSEVKKDFFNKLIEVSQKELAVTGSTDKEKYILSCKLDTLKEIIK